MNNKFYIQINDNTNITSGKFLDETVFVSIGQKDRFYNIIDVNNSGEQNKKDLDAYLHFTSIDDIDRLIKSLEITKHNLYYEILNNQNDEYNYGNQIEYKNDTESI